MTDEIHPDAYCTLSNLPCGDLSEALHERDTLRAQVDGLKAAGRQARDDATAALDLVSRIRMALNDNGKRMQDELLIYCRELAALPYRVAELEAERDRYRAALDAVREEIAGCLKRDTDAFAQMTLDQVEHWNVSRHMQSHGYCLDQIDAAIAPKP